MADPLASALTAVTVAVQTAISLAETIKRYKQRDKTMKRLQEEIEDLTGVLKKLQEAIAALDASMVQLLQGPVDRCNKLCSDFEETMRKFSGKSKTGLLDWTRMEFMRSDINAFIDTLAGYKSTINIALGTITMNTSVLTQNVLEDYHEIIKDTIYEFQVRLQRIEDEIAHSDPNSSTDSETNINLEDEKEVTKQCLRICEDARSHLEALQDQEPSLHKTADIGQTPFEGLRMTSQALSESRDKIAETVGRLQARLDFLDQEGPGRTLDKIQLQEDLDVQKQCLELCKQASDQVSNRKIHTFGEIVADSNSDQIVITTVADIFDVRKVLANQASMQLVGSMGTDEALVKVAEYRYNSRQGAVNPQVDVTVSSAPPESRQRSTAHPNQTKKEGQQANDRQAPNTVKKRTAQGDKKGES